MVNYANGKIYKICSINGEDECYIGSTTQGLSTRMSKHRHEYLTKHAGPNSKILFDKYGIKNCKIVLIKKLPCTCKEELDAEEAYHIKNNNCVNKQIPGRTKKEYYEDNKETIDEKRKIKVKCICGTTVRKSDLAKHKKTKHHIEDEQAFFDGCEEALQDLYNK